MLQRTIDTAKFLASDPVPGFRGGLTPHEIVFRQGNSSLRHFAPIGAVKAAPVFISMPLINNWYIWDLMPHVSLVGALTKAGIPVYVLDWGAPSTEDSARPLSYYIDGILGRMIDRTRRDAAKRYEATDLRAIGYCVGGTFLATHLARFPGSISHVAFVATPIDFHNSGRLAVWANPKNFPVDTLIDGVGNYPGEMMRTSFQWLKPTGQTRKWVGLWERIENPEFRDMWTAMEHWANDAIDFPGEAYREYIRQCYFENSLINGGWFLGGKAVSLANAKIPALTIAASEDHIAPVAAVEGLAKAWGGPVTTETMKGGHVGISVQRSLHDRLIKWATA